MFYYSDIIMSPGPGVVNPVDLGNGWGYYVYLEEDDIIRGLYSIPEEKEDDCIDDEGPYDRSAYDRSAYDRRGEGWGEGEGEGEGDGEGEYGVIKNSGNVKQSYIGNMIHRILMGITIYFGIY